MLTHCVKEISIRLTHFTEEILISGIDADFRGLLPRAKEVTSAIENASGDLTTPARTNLTMSSKGLSNAILAWLCQVSFARFQMLGEHCSA